VISNIVAGPLDGALMRFAKRQRLRYTRYVDDISLSANSRHAIDQCLSEPSAGQHFLRGAGVLSPNLVQMVASQGFAVNFEKVFFSSRAARQQVNNVTINEKLNVPRRMISGVRGALHAIEKFGLEKAQERYEATLRPTINSGGSLSARLKGQILYIGQVTQRGPTYRTLADRANTAVPGLGLPIGEPDAMVATVVAEHYISQASAFHIGGGIFLTAAHAFDAGAVVTFHRALNGHSFSGVEIDRDDILDFAVYRTTDAQAIALPALPLSPRQPGIGDTVRAYGFPNYSPGNSITMVEAAVIGHSSRMGSRRLDLNQRLEHGASGGPVLSLTGRVVGIVHGGPSKDDAMPVANTITPLSKFVDRLTAQLVSESSEIVPLPI